jgi:hypothetical protein
MVNPRESSDSYFRIVSSTCSRVIFSFSRPALPKAQSRLNSRSGVAVCGLSCAIRFISRTTLSSKARISDFVIRLLLLAGCIEYTIGIPPSTLQGSYFTQIRCSSPADSVHTKYCTFAGNRASRYIKFAQIGNAKPPYTLPSSLGSSLRRIAFKDAQSVSDKGVGTCPVRSSLLRRCPAGHRTRRTPPDCDFSRASSVRDTRQRVLKLAP